MGLKPSLRRHLRNQPEEVTNQGLSPPTQRLTMTLYPVKKHTQHKAQRADPPLSKMYPDFQENKQTVILVSPY